MSQLQEPYFKSALQIPKMGDKVPSDSASDQEVLAFGSGLKSHFLFDPNFRNLNHGNFHLISHLRAILHRVSH